MQWLFFKNVSLWQYYRDNTNNNITKSEAFKSKIRKAGKTPVADNTKDIKIAVPLKYLSNFWRTLETPLTNCEVNLILTWSTDCANSSAIGETKFATADTNFTFQL